MRLDLGLNTFEELPDGEVYEVDLLGVTPSDLPDLEFREAERILLEIATLLNSCEGIEVTADETLRARDVTLEDLKTRKQWDTSALSLRLHGPISEEG